MPLVRAASPWSDEGSRAHRMTRLRTSSAPTPGTARRRFPTAPGKVHKNLPFTCSRRDNHGALGPSRETRCLWSRGSLAVEFRHFVQLIAIGLQARIPMHMTGFPGVGKTEFAKSLEAGFDRVGIKCKVVVLVGSIREPQDFGGFPVSTPDGVRLLPMAWARDAQRLAEDGYLVVVFLDELTTVPPTTQAAMLRLLTENVCGELRLPDYVPGKGGVVYLCASNAVEWAAGGQEIQAPMANRLWHGEFPMDHETWCDLMVSDFPAPGNMPVLPADYLGRYHHRQRATIAAYVRAAGRDAWLAPPTDPARRSGPWPSGRTWYLASRFLAAI